VENCYIKVRCIKRLENVEQECVKSWRNDNNLMKFLPETAAFLDPLRDADSTA